jgi:serine/threonine-protein phosphatase 2A regulatory subunit B
MTLAMLTYSFRGFWGQVKEHRVKKVKEIDHNPLVCSENALLAERSFMSGQDKPSVDNGYHLERTEKMAANTLPFQEVHPKVGICGL